MLYIHKQFLSTKAESNQINDIGSKFIVAEVNHTHCFSVFNVSQGTGFEAGGCGQHSHNLTPFHPRQRLALGGPQCFLYPTLSTARS